MRHASAVAGADGRALDVRHGPHRLYVFLQQPDLAVQRHEERIVVQKWRRLCDDGLPADKFAALAGGQMRLRHGSRDALAEVI